MTQRAKLLRLAGAALMLIAILLWNLAALERSQSAASQFFFAIYSDVPQAMADPSITLRDSGGRVELKVFSAAAARVRVIIPSSQSCATDVRRDLSTALANSDAVAPPEYRTLDISLKPGIPQSLECVPDRPPRSLGFTQREMTLGMIRPASISAQLTRAMTPAHQVRIAVASGSFEGGTFAGGLDAPVVSSEPHMLGASDETNARYLSRYGAAFQPSIAIQWRDARAELICFVALALVAILTVLCANALYALLTAT